MPMQPGKRIISYNLPTEMTLQDFRRIVQETESLRGDTRVLLPRTMGQRDAEHIQFVMEEEWPDK